MSEKITSARTPERSLSQAPADPVPSHQASEASRVGNQAPADQPPNGGYGWVCVACVGLINMHSWGLNSSYGVFLSYFARNNTFPGAGLLDFAFVGGLSVSVSFLLAPIATLCMRQFGTRSTLLLGVVFETLSLITASFSTQIWHLFLSQGVCFGIGLGFLYVASVGIIPQWFTTKRSFANACGAAGSGLGGLVYNLVSQAVISDAGWRWAYRTIGICAFVVTLICALLIKDRNKAVGAQFKLLDYKLLARPEFLLFQGWGFFNMLGYLVLVYSLPDYATSIGLNPRQGSIVGAILNLGQAVGRPLVGLSSDRVGRINIATALTAICGVLCLVWWIFASTFGTLVSFALVAGTVSGTYWATIAPVGAEVVGLQDLPSALSLAFLGIVIPVTFSEVIALEIESNTAYIYAQIYTGLMYIASAICLLFVRAWKIGDLERSGAAVDENGHVTSTAKPNWSENSDMSVESPPKHGLIRRALMWKRV